MRLIGRRREQHAASAVLLDHRGLNRRFSLQTVPLCLKHRRRAVASLQTPGQTRCAVPLGNRLRPVRETRAEVRLHALTFSHDVRLLSCRATHFEPTHLPCTVVPLSANCTALGPSWSLTTRTGNILRERRSRHERELGCCRELPVSVFLLPLPSLLSADKQGSLYTLCPLPKPETFISAASSHASHSKTSSNLQKLHDPNAPG